MALHWIQLLLECVQRKFYKLLEPCWYFIYSPRMSLRSPTTLSCSIYTILFWCPCRWCEVPPLGTKPKQVIASFQTHVNCCSIRDNIVFHHLSVLNMANKELYLRTVCIYSSGKLISLFMQLVAQMRSLLFQQVSFPCLRNILVPYLRYNETKLVFWLYQKIRSLFVDVHKNRNAKCQLST